MLSSLAPFATLALFVSTATAQNPFTVNTPSNVVQCLTSQLTWTTGGTPPFDLSVHMAATPGDAAIVDFPNLNGTSISWLVNIQANTQLSLALRDANGVIVQSGAFTIQPGPNSDCLTASVSYSAAGGSGAPATQPPAGGSSASGAPAGTTTLATVGTTSPAAGTSSAPKPASSAGSPTSSRASGASTSAGASQTPNAASGTLVQGGVVGVLSAILLALMA